MVRYSRFPSSPSSNTTISSNLSVRMDLPSTLDRCLFLFAGGRGMMSHYQPVSVDGRIAAAALEIDLDGRARAHAAGQLGAGDGAVEGGQQLRLQLDEAQPEL